MARRYLDNSGRYDRPIFADGGQYLIKRGDTLWDLSKKYLGDPFKYKELAKLNNIKNPDLIYAGRYLTLPDGRTVDTQTNTVVTPETSKVIANHDKLYDYKIEDGKLYTRRKNSDTGWVDISNNNDARAKIEHFTNSRIEDTKNKNNNNVAGANQVASDSTKVAVDSVPTNQTNIRTNGENSNDSLVPNPINVKTPIDTAYTSSDSIKSSYTQNRPSLATAQGTDTTDYFGKALPEITVTAKGKPNKTETGLLTEEDLKRNNWHWTTNGGKGISKNSNTNSAAYDDANKKVAEGEEVLVNEYGKIVTKAEVDKYISRGRIPMYVSDYDAQFWQPQSESEPHEVRMAKLRAWENKFDRERNQMLLLGFGTPALAMGLATAAPEVIGGYLVGEALNWGAKKMGFDWDKMFEGDPTGELYGSMLNPARLVGGVLGGWGGNVAKTAAKEAYIPSDGTPGLSSIVNKVLYNNKPNMQPIGDFVKKVVNTTGEEINKAVLSRAMNKSLRNKALNKQDKKALQDALPYLFDTDPALFRYNYNNPALPNNLTGGPYIIPNYVNGVPMGVPYRQPVLGENTWSIFDYLTAGRPSGISYMAI